MKILCCGDSWTEGFGVNKDKAWPAVLQRLTGHQVNVLARCGATNSDIRNFYLHHQKYSPSKKNNQQYDLVIFCWSGVTRTRIEGHVLEFSPSPSTDNLKLQRSNYFKDKSLNDLIISWQNLMDEVDSADTIPKIHFSVFGDRAIREKNNFFKISFLEFLAERQNTKFNYEIPIFEFGWLSHDNFNLVDDFAKLYFPNHWLKAIVEREDVKSGKYFLDCGHPNERGHKLWAKYIASIL